MTSPLSSASSFLFKLLIVTQKTVFSKYDHRQQDKQLQNSKSSKLPQPLKVTRRNRMFSYFLAVFGNSCSNTLRLVLGSITEELSYRRKSDNCRDIFPVLRFRMLKGKANLSKLFPCTAFHSIHYQLLLSLFISTSACPSPSLPSADTLGKKEISSRWTLLTWFTTEFSMFYKTLSLWRPYLVLSYFNPIKPF